MQVGIFVNLSFDVSQASRIVSGLYNRHSINIYQINQCYIKHTSVHNFLHIFYLYVNREECIQETVNKPDK